MTYKDGKPLHDQNIVSGPRMKEEEDTPIDLTDGKQIDGRQPFHLDLLQIGVIQQCNRSNTQPPRTGKENPIITSFTERLSVSHP